MNARDFMSTSFVAGRSDHSLSDACDLMLTNNLSEILVLDDNNRVVGILNDSDFIGKKVTAPHAMVSMNELFGQPFNEQKIENVYSHTRTKKLNDIVNRNYASISPTASLTDVVELMHDKQAKVVVVIQDDRPIGTISYKDVLKAYKNTH